MAAPANSGKFNNPLASLSSFSVTSSTVVADKSIPKPSLLVMLFPKIEF